MNLNRRAKLSGAKDLIAHALALLPPRSRRLLATALSSWLWTLFKLAKLIPSFCYDVAANVHDD